MPSLLLVDGHNLLHRAAFGFPARITSRGGRDITCAFGFFALLRAAARSLDEPPQIVVVFDGQNGAAARRTILPSYKPPVAGDDEVFADLPAIRDGLDLLGIPCIEDDRWEADDVIATLIDQAPGRRRLVMSTDKDFYQLLDRQTFLLNSTRRADQRIIDAAEVHARHLVHPDQWCDYRALTGDPSDNIPGIRGIGPVTAARTLAGGVHLDDLDKLGRLDSRAGALIRHHWETLIAARSLIRLRSDLPVQPPTSRTQHELPPAPEIVGRLGLWNECRTTRNAVRAPYLAGKQDNGTTAIGPCGMRHSAQNGPIRYAPGTF